MQICTTNIHVECIPEVHQIQKESPKKQQKIYHSMTQEYIFIGILRCEWPVSLDYVSRIYNQAKTDY